MLTASAVDKLLSLNIYAMPSSSKLKRSEHTGRYFITEGDIGEYFNDRSTKQLLGDITGADLSNTRTRLELCVDLPGFSLEPHVDIPEKLLTLQIYLQGEPHCGTDLYPDRVDFQPNRGWMIRNQPGTVHGFEPREFTENRVSLILNYVNDDWWDVKQLYQA